MAHGLVYLSCYPNLTLSCTDHESIYSALTLNIQIKGYNMDSRSKYLLIIIVKSHDNLNPKCLMSSLKGETLIFQ